MFRTDPSPPVWRIVAAFLVAPACAALANSLAEQAEIGVVKSTLFIAAIGAYPTTLLFGVPLFWFLYGRVQPTIVRCVVAGAAVAAAPWLLLFLLAPPDSLAVAGFMAGVAAMGLLGGSVFWIVAAARLKQGPATAA